MHHAQMPGMRLLVGCTRTKPVLGQILRQSLAKFHFLSVYLNEIFVPCGIVSSGTMANVYTSVLLIKGDAKNGR